MYQLFCNCHRSRHYLARLLPLLGILAGAAPCGAQIMIWQPGQREIKLSTPPVAPEQEAPRIWTVTPAKEPLPNLKYRFWEPLALRSAGSASAVIAQARLAQLSLPHISQLNKQHAERQEYWGTCPLDQLPQSDLPNYLKAHERVLKLVYAATDRSNVELYRRVETEDQSPWNDDYSSVQDYRQFARLLVLESRLHLANGQIDEALKSIGVGFRMSQLCELEQPSIVSKLVQIAICGLMHGAVAEIAQHPDCPNLYWALASLPENFWSMRLAYEGEQRFAARILAPLQEPLPDGTSEAEVVNRLIQAITLMPQALNGDNRLTDSQARLLAGLAILVYADKGRERLQELGMTHDAIGKLTPAAAVILSTQLAYQAASDRIYKWTLIENNRQGLQQAMQGMDMTSALDPAEVILGLLIPALQASESAGQRAYTVHRRELVREALRAYAAAHGNKLPKDLNDLHPLPAPHNPQTGRPFDYQWISDKEVLVRNQPAYPGDNQTETRIILR